MTVAYPLQWPEGWPRGQKLPKGAGRFITTFEKTRQRLLAEIGRLKATNLVISSNLPLRQDGYPRADVARYRIGDPGVALYFMRNGKQLVMARDAYDSVYDNLHSLTLAIEHLRGLERHGGGAMMERAFEGFAALPEPGNASHRRPWYRALGYDMPDELTLAECEQRFRELARTCHPDMQGGSHEAMAELNAAIAKAREVLGA